MRHRHIIQPLFEHILTKFPPLSGHQGHRISRHLSGHLKNVVYKSKPDEIDNLKDRIRQEINNIS